MFNNFRKFLKTSEGSGFWLFVLVLVPSIAAIVAEVWACFHIDDYFLLPIFLLFPFIGGCWGIIWFIMGLFGTRDHVGYMDLYYEYLRNQEALEKTAENVDKNQVKSDVKQIVKEHQSDMEKIIHQAMQKPQKTETTPISQDNLRKEFDDILEQVVSGKMSKKETMKKVAEIMKKHKQQNSDIKKQIDALNSGHEM